MSLLRWLKWWLLDSRRCAHARGEGRYVNGGMNKVWHCTKCGKCLDMI